MTSLPDTKLLDEISQHFMRAVASAHGNEVASEVVESLGTILGKAWKNQLVMNKLTGNFQEIKSISLRLTDLSLYRSEDNSTSSPISRKIKAIKELRSLSGLTLTDTKRIVEAAEDNWQTVRLDRCHQGTYLMSWDHHLVDSINKLRECGFEVNFS